METSRYRAFIRAVDKGSLSQAAKDLGYTPSGVSQLIGALERDLGFSVLERTAQGVSPTKQGATVLSVARAIVSEEDRLLQMSAEIKGLSTGRVTIGSYSSVATHWLPRIIQLFHERYPAIEIRVMEGIHQEITAWLNSKEVDIGFISYDPTMPYDWIPLAHDPMVAVLPANHSLAQSDSFPLEACNGEPFIMPGRGQDIDTASLLERNNIHPHIVYETIENAAMYAMVEQGMGMSITNKLATHRYTFDIALLPVNPPQSIFLGIALPSLKTASPAVHHFLTYATKELQE